MRSQTSYERLSANTNQRWLGTMLTVLRVAVGVLFFLAGFAKMSDWSAAGYLANATGPLSGWFQSLAGNPTVDFLNVWGLTLIGVALIIGLMVRPASFFGAILMVLYYLSDLEGNTAHGFIDEHVILALLFGLFMAGGFGHALGLDGLAREHFRKAGRWVGLIFG
jgi:thiosulfate dehydrogenase [quinone] large subunit